MCISSSVRSSVCVACSYSQLVPVPILSGIDFLSQAFASLPQAQGKRLASGKDAQGFDVPTWLWADDVVSLTVLFKVKKLWKNGKDRADATSYAALTKRAFCMIALPPLNTYVAFDFDLLLTIGFKIPPMCFECACFFRIFREMTHGC